MICFFVVISLVFSYDDVLTSFTSILHFVNQFSFLNEESRIMRTSCHCFGVCVVTPFNF
jgi:hypothetical protein